MSTCSFISKSNKMFHVEHRFLLMICLLFPVLVSAQSGLHKTANLTPEETVVLEDINLLRQDPAMFFRNYIVPYADSDRSIGRSWIRSLRHEVSHLSSLPRLTISLTMERTAKFMANDLARFNGHRLSHTSSGGLTFEERMKNAGVDCAGENLYEGINRTPIQMVMDLLIDWRVPGLGHRKNLLDPDYKSIGISIFDFGQGGQILVTDFSCGNVPRGT